jgi:hypothetical protein
MIRTVIFAKAPVAGQAKTRLIPALGPAGSARLALQLLEHTVAEVVAADTGPVELCVAPSLSHPTFNGLEIPQSVGWSEQGNGNLGERMARATQRVIGNAEHIMLVGTDCPELTRVQLQAAAAALVDHDACMVPVSDGGYSLLGLRRHLPALFCEMPWSTDRVAGMTCARIAAAGWSLTMLPQLHDIDEPGDLQWLPADWGYT